MWPVTLVCSVCFLFIEWVAAPGHEEMFIEHPGCVSVSFRLACGFGFCCVTQSSGSLVVTGVWSQVSLRLPWYILGDGMVLPGYGI